MRFSGEKCDTEIRAAVADVAGDGRWDGSWGRRAAIRKSAVVERMRVKIVACVIAVVGLTTGGVGAQTTAQRPAATVASSIFSSITQADRPFFTEYIKDVIFKTEADWYDHIPKRARGQHGKKGEVVIQFVIHRNGRVSDIVLVHPSGDAGLDHAARNALLKASPYIIFPKSIVEDEIKLQFDFLYNEQPDSVPAVAQATDGQASPVTARPQQSSEVNTAWPLSDSDRMWASKYFPNASHKTMKMWYRLIPTEDLGPGIKMGNVIVDFIVHRDGTVTDERLVQSVGDAGIDQAAMQAIRMASPFGRFPKKIQEKQIEARFVFPYDGDMY